MAHTYYRIHAMSNLGTCGVGVGEVPTRSLQDGGCLCRVHGQSWKREELAPTWENTRTLAELRVQAGDGAQLIERLFGFKPRLDKVELAYNPTRSSRPLQVQGQPWTL